MELPLEPFLIFTTENILYICCEYLNYFKISLIFFGIKISQWESLVIMLRICMNT